MSDNRNLESTTLAERVVLLGIAHLAGADETPVHSAMVVRVCSRKFDDLKADVLGKLSEADAVRTLNRLEADGFVSEIEDADTSPVGKGRPRYTLDVHRNGLLDTLAEDDRLADVVTRIREGAA